ncbi:MAG: RhuM family protein [Polaromonas sp.]
MFQGSLMSEVLIFDAASGVPSVEVRLDGETVWLTQEQMALLFGRERSVVTKHLRNVFREGEHDPAATCAKFALVQIEGSRMVTRDIDHYNLDAIISVGYRVPTISQRVLHRLHAKGMPPLHRWAGLPTWN